MIRECAIESDLLIYLIKLIFANATQPPPKMLLSSKVVKITIFGRHGRNRVQAESSVFSFFNQLICCSDVLEDVSDISDGDIPDIPEKEMDDIEPEVVKPGKIL